ncbi:hypothetical protein HYDPIDRAFT_135729 [Hydnomerulius pinastri MD-312]|uniref:DUF6533 domain-containing protein n=1 Tax=Hydnomerulius pinastri MD-312 TaxID=994086 RepID=A0A0C9W6Q1_9AGAM|nr:hypothetical protein HYDPIDRAFT_135729 [Hydnomerulius pinastri MD-312]
MRTSRYSNIAALAILVFDYCIMFDDEVRWVWGRRWDATRVVFTLSRYLPFIGVGMTCYAAVKISRTGNCIPFNITSDAIHIMSIIFAEALLVLRTYAFWQRDKRLLIGLWILGGLCVAGAVLISNVIPSKSVASGSSGSDNSGCVFRSSRNSAKQYAFLMLFEMTIVGLTAYKRFGQYRHGSNSLVTKLYRDGMMYIFSIMLVSVANIIIVTVAPIGYSNMVDSLQIAVHSVIASRILFNLRKDDRRDYFRSLPVEISEFRAPPRPTDSGESGSSGYQSTESALWKQPV